MNNTQIVVLVDTPRGQVLLTYIGWAGNKGIVLTKSLAGSQI